MVHSLLSLSTVAALIVSAAAFTGRGTFFEVGLGACGQVNTDSQFVVAINPTQYGSGGHCFHNVQISANGHTATAEVVDKCPGCGDNDLDMSPSLFEQFAPLSQGVVTVTWNFV